MSTSSSAIADALITMLSAASVLGAGNVSKNSYRPLELSACAAAVISFNSLSGTVQAFTGTRGRTWRMNINLYVRDMGVAEESIDHIYSFTDKTLLCLEADDTIQDTVSETVEIRATRNELEWVEAGGHNWAPINFQIELLELL